MSQGQSRAEGAIGASEARSKTAGPGHRLPHAGDGPDPDCAKCNGYGAIFMRDRVGAGHDFSYPCPECRTPIARATEPTS